MSTSTISKEDFLVEIGTAEMPPKSLKTIAHAFKQHVQAGLEAKQLRYDNVDLFFTPRRLALYIKDLATHQPDSEIERAGPPMKVAFKDGQATKAALKFAESFNVSVDVLGSIETPKGEYLNYRGIQKGLPTQELIGDIIADALNALPIAKKMRWGMSEAEFIRPVYWLVMLFGQELIDYEIFDIKSDRITRGHRFNGEPLLSIEQPSAYKNLLQHVGNVIVDADERKHLIRTQTYDIVKDINGQAIIDESLLDEVNALVEMPTPVLGDFPNKFLELPREVLISTLQEHQKYFPIRNDQDELLPHFITISNIKSTKPEEVKAGNERVIMPRLADAEFFWNGDRKKSLEQRITDLDKVVFQRELGTLGEKSQRVSQLSVHIAKLIDADIDKCERAASLAKCDLLTDMVGEFPDLQGIMGYYYAQQDGEDSEVAMAIKEHYLPKFSGDAVPTNKVSLVVSLADKLDTLTGIFSLGKIPTGTRDPFGLRRLSIGILRSITENRLTLNLRELVETAERLQPLKIRRPETVNQVMEYLTERFKFILIENGFSHDQINAVLAVADNDLIDIIERLKAIQEFSALPVASNLAAANKRVSNILKKNLDEANQLPEIKVNQISEKAEYALYQALTPLQAEFEGLYKAKRYKDILLRLARLKDPIDDFFDNVMVMSDNLIEQNNRLNLLKDFKHFSTYVADLSELNFEA